jgi:hypothetical protein
MAISLNLSTEYTPELPSKRIAEQAEQSQGSFSHKSKFL